MGLCTSQLSGVFQTLHLRVLMVGLDNAGKTTLLYRLKSNEQVKTIPTFGFNTETVQSKTGASFTVWDLGGQEKIRNLWKFYFRNTGGLLFVVDSSDRERIGQAADILHGILKEQELQGVPLVVIANKQDLPNAMSCSELIDGLGLSNVAHAWHIEATCATTGSGVWESMDSLAKLFRAKENTIS